MHSANDRIRTSVSTETARALSAYFSNCHLFTFLLHIGIHFLLIAKTWAADTVRRSPKSFLTVPAATLSGRPSDVRIAGLSAVARLPETTTSPHRSITANRCSWLVVRLFHYGKRRVTVSFY